MTVINPPGFLQNAGATHTAEQMRNHFAVLSGVGLASGTLIPRGGVLFGRGNSLAVTQTGSPSMAVLVRSGVAMVPGTEGAKQAGYMVLNDADVTLSIAAAHATLNRIDIVCFKVEDTAYSGGVNASSLVVVTGTPAGSPVAPTAPNNSITLASVSVVALDTSITNGEITDLRFYLPNGGIMPIRNSSGRPDGAAISPGHMNWNIGGGKFEFWNGTTWVDGMPLYKARSTLGGSAASVSFTSIPTNLRKLEVSWTARGDTAAGLVQVRFRINNDSGANYQQEVLQSSNAGFIGANETAQTTGRFGNMTGSTATAGMFGSGTADFVGWDSPHSGYLGYTCTTQTMTSGSQTIEVVGGTFTTAGPYNRLDIIANSGNFVAGSDFSVVGVYI